MIASDTCTNVRALCKNKEMSTMPGLVLSFCLTVPQLIKSYMLQIEVKLRCRNNRTYLGQSIIMMPPSSSYMVSLLTRLGNEGRTSRIDRKPLPASTTSITSPSLSVIYLTQRDITHNTCHHCWWYTCHHYRWYTWHREISHITPVITVGDIPVITIGDIPDREISHITPAITVGDIPVITVSDIPDTERYHT